VGRAGGEGWGRGQGDNEKKHLLFSIERRQLLGT